MLYGFAYLKEPTSITDIIRFSSFIGRFYPKGLEYQRPQPVWASSLIGHPIDEYYSQKQP